MEPLGEAAQGRCRLYILKVIWEEVKTIRATKDDQSNIAEGRTPADSRTSKIKLQFLLDMLQGANFLFLFRQSGRPRFGQL